MSRTPHLYAAVFGLFINDKWEVLLLKRQNTGYFDGGYSLPAWHVEDAELCSAALQHEMQEEIGITVTQQNLKPFHVIHRIAQDRQYFDIGYVITEWTGEIQNTEPDKCSALEWFAFDALPEMITTEARTFVEAYRDKGARFSEINMRG